MPSSGVEIYTLREHCIYNKEINLKKKEKKGQEEESQAIRTVMGTVRAWGRTRLHGSFCVVVLATWSLKLATQSEVHCDCM